MSSPNLRYLNHMRRLLFASALVAGLASNAAAQAEAPAAPTDPSAPPATAPATDPPAAATPANPTPPPPAVTTISTPPAAPVKEDKPAEPPPPKKLSVGKEKGFFTPGILLQGWYVLDHAGGKIFTDNDGTSRPTDTTNTFRLRRAEMSAKGEIIPKRVGFALMFDVAKVREMQNKTIKTATGDTVVVQQPVGSIAPLQDFYITFLSDVADVSVGQFKIPVSWEGLYSSAKIILPERAVVSTTFGDKRDMGLRIAKAFPKWGYHVGIYNGLGLNNLDNNNQKDVALRLEAYPVKGLTIAGMAYDSVGYRDRAGTKDRWEADLRYEGGGLLFQAEYIEARDVKTENADPLKARGFYAALAYTLPAGDGHQLQPVVRVGYLDPNASKNLDPATDKDDELWHYDVGLNYYLQGHEMKLQAAYQRKQFETATAVNELILAAQVWY